MKSIFRCSFCIVLLIFNTTMGQSSEYKQGDLIITGNIAPIGLDGVGYHGVVEYMYTTHLGFGGGIGKYSFEEYQNKGTLLEWKWEGSYIELVGTASYTIALHDIPDLYLFGNIYFGYAIASVSGHWTQLNNGEFEPSYDADNYIEGAYLGARYFLSENIAGFGAFGMGLGNLQIGVSFKL